MRPELGIIVTYLGLVESPFDEAQDAFICPACGGMPELAYPHKDGRAWLICMTEGCQCQNREYIEKNR